MSQRPCHNVKSSYVSYLNKKPRSCNRGTIAGERQQLPGSAGGCRRWMKHEAEAVDAIAKAGRLRPVVEDVAEMAAAAAAVHLGAQHAVGAVLGLADIAFDGLIEARPSGAAFEFGFGGKQRQVTA